MPKYTEADVRKALDAINRGSTIAAAATKFGIPRTTLSGKHHNVYPIEIQKGPPTILTKEEEKHLEDWIFHLCDSGFAITPGQLLDSVQHLVKELKRETPFTDGRPGRKWYESYMRRHPEVNIKLSRNLSNPRTLVTQENIKNWFMEVRDYLTKENLLDVINDPDRVFNMDESAFFLCPKGDRVLVRKSSKTVYNFVNNDDKECLTALVGGNAAGKLMPSMVVYPYQRIPAVISELFPKTWAMGRSENGWMTSETFYEFIANIFHPWLLKEKIKLPVILFVDGHSSHGTMHLTNFCKNNQIVLIALYPNSTHFMQPMDVSCFHPLKVGWKKGVRKWRFDNDGIKLKRENFAPLLEKVIFDAIKPETIINGFRKCGLHPFTQEAVNFKDMMVRSTDKEPNARVPNDTQINDAIDYEKFFEWIQKSIPEELLNDFKTSGEVWNGNVEHNSLFGFWHKHSVLALSCADRSAVHLETHIDTSHDANLSESEPVFTIDSQSIPTVDLEGIEYVPIEDIVIVDNSQDTLVENDLSVERLHNSIDDTDGFRIADGCLSSDSEVSGGNSSDDESVSGDDIEGCIEAVDVREETIVDPECPASSKRIVDNVEIDTSIVQNASHIPPNTPAAFAKVLFFPGEKHLSEQNKRRRKKRKVPSVLTSDQYAEYLKEKELQKEEKERLKVQRKMEREEVKQRKEDEKKVREAKRAERMEAIAVKKAELASKKVETAKRREDMAAKKADEAARKASLKKSQSSSASAKKRKIDNKTGPQNLPHGA